jgi:hypothetical protein
VVRHGNGTLVGRARVDGLTYVEMPLNVEYGAATSLFLNAETGATGDGVAIPTDSRTMNYRVLACGRGALNPDRRRARLTREPWSAKIVGTGPEEVNWEEQLSDSQRAIALMGKPAFLHINACGDFTLMHRDDWFNLRGYAELDQFSMHLDSMLCYAAHHLGIQEEMLREPMRIYHIEHGAGSGFTPEGQKQMYDRIAKAGIQVITFGDLIAMVAQMRKIHAPLLFNLDDWGMAALPLAEYSPMKERPLAVSR